MIEVVHLIDDCSMGGVTVALKNFDDPRLQEVARSHTLVVDPYDIVAPRLVSRIIVIHFTVNWRKLPFLVTLRRRNPDAYIILEEHSYTEGFQKWNVSNHNRFHRMLRYAYGCVDCVVAVSEGQSKWLSQIVSGVSIRPIPQSRKLESFKAVKPLRYAHPDSIIFGAIGRFHKQKGFDDLITAFRSPDLAGATLLIAGDGAEKEKLDRLARGATNIQFVGATDDPSSFYAKVDCIIVPSRWEAFGLVASEAMAAGKLVVARNIDGLSEQVRGYGQLTSSNGIDALHDTMADVAISGRETLIERGEKSRQTALNRYDKMISDWRKLLNEIQPSERAFCASAAAAFNPKPSRMSPGQ